MSFSYFISRRTHFPSIRRGFLFLGLGFFLIGVCTTISDLALRSHSQQTQAHFISKAPPNIAGKSIITIIEYVVDGKSYTHSTFKRGGTFTNGDGETIFYDPQNPTSMREKDQLQSELGFAVAGIVLLIIWRLLKSGESEPVPELPYGKTSVPSNDDEIPSDLGDH